MVFLYSSSDSLTQKKEGIERLGSSTSPVIMADEESYTFDSLSKMMVFDLREICKKEELPSSGNKAELIVRILGHFSSDNDNEDLFIEEDSSESFPQKSKIEGKEEAVRSSKDMDDAIDRLLSRVQTKDNPEIEDNSVEKDITDESKIVEEIMEAEIVEAEIIEKPVLTHEEPSLILDEDDPWSLEHNQEKIIVEDTSEEKIDQPSMTIVLPSIDIFKKYWQQISAVFMVVLLVGAGVVYFLSADSSFQARRFVISKHDDSSFPRRMIRHFQASRTIRHFQAGRFVISTQDDSSFPRRTIRHCHAKRFVLARQDDSSLPRTTIRRSHARRFVASTQENLQWLNNRENSSNVDDF